MNNDELLTEHMEGSDSTETKAEKFQRLAVKRMDKVLKDIDALSNLSGSNYEYTEEQVNKMFTAIEEATKEAQSKFQKKQKKNTTGFTF